MFPFVQQKWGNLRVVFTFFFLIFEKNVGKCTETDQYVARGEWHRDTVPESLTTVLTMSILKHAKIFL